jgi:hypothetical protein
MEYPNKIYVSEYKGGDFVGGTFHFVIVVAASDIDTAKQYVFEKIGITVNPVWLMHSKYPIIYSSDGSVPLSTQAKILYNGNYHTY